MSINREARVDWIDTAKGEGILLVVLGHALISGRLYSAIYLFHMPMFFILSGLVFRPDSTWTTFWKRVRSLMIPYASFLVILTLMRDAVHYHHGAHLKWLVTSDLHQMLLGLEGGTSLTGDFGTFWFVSCLFLSLIVYNGLRSRLQNPLSARMILLMVASLLASYPLRRISLPWCASIVPSAVFFIWVGECWSLLFNSGRCRADGLGPVLLSTVLACIGLEWFEPFDMKYGIYGTPILSVVAAIAMSHLFFVGCMRIARLPVLGAYAVRLGQATLVILFLHRFFVIHLDGQIPTLAIIIVATAIPFASWLVIRQSPPLLRQALLGERSPRGKSQDGSASVKNRRNI